MSPLPNISRIPTLKLWALMSVVAVMMLPVAPAALAQSGAGSDSGVMGTELPQPRKAPRVREKDIDPTVLRARYVEALGLLADGDRQAAVESLGQLEREFVEPSMKLDEGPLWEVQGEVALDLSRRNPEVLVPILMLHHDASGLFQQQRVWHLARRSRLLAAALADSYADRARSEGSRVVAARTYASLGGYLHQIMSTRNCRCTPFYRRALDYDPKNEAALLGLATVFEKAGDPVAAVAFLRKLVEVHPRNREAALRLAVNQLRSGFRKNAERGFEELTGIDGPEWVVAVAFQELARHYIDREDLQAALDVLQRGRERLPGNEPLALQYAYLLERDRQLNQAADVLAAFRTEPPRQAADARARYNHWPAATVDDVRRQLWQGAESRLPMLAAALSKTQPRQEG